MRKSDKGVLRIRVAAGWVSEKAGSGQVILHEIRPLEPENHWEDLDGAELKEARSPRAAAEILASGSQLPPPLEPLVEEGAAPWMVRATAVERAATAARAAHRSRCLKVKRVVRANEFSPMHVEGTPFKDAPVRDGLYISVDRDLWTQVSSLKHDVLLKHDGFSTKEWRFAFKNRAASRHGSGSRSRRIQRRAGPATAFWSTLWRRTAGSTLTHTHTANSNRKSSGRAFRARCDSHCLPTVFRLFCD